MGSCTTADPKITSDTSFSTQQEGQKITPALQRGRRIPVLQLVVIAPHLDISLKIFFSSSNPLLPITLKPFIMR